MEGFLALARKELLEQRRTWRFVGTTGVFTAVALLTMLIPLIVSLVQGTERTADDVRGLLFVFGITLVTLGALVSIIVAMGLLANERSTGTAGMTLSKPVTRAAFVLVKHLGLALTLFSALFFGAGVAYILALAFFGDPGFPRYLLYMATVGLWILFMGSVTLFWSSMFRRQIVAAGLAAVIFFAQFPLSAIPHTGDFWPVNGPEWGAERMGESSLFRSDGPVSSGAQDRWPALVISMGGIVLLGVGAWAVFRRQEL